MKENIMINQCTAYIQLISKFSINVICLYSNTNGPDVYTYAREEFILLYTIII